MGTARGIELDLEHGGVRQDDLLVRHEHGRLHAGVGDDGRGFDPVNRSSHDAGLASPCSRAVRLGGRFVVQAAPGEGALLQLEYLLT